MKSVTGILFASAVLFFAAYTSVSAQSKGKPVPPQIPPQLSVPSQPTMVAVDAPPPPPPPLTANIMELRFGSQATGVQSCLQVTVTNTSPAAQAVTKIMTDDEKHYTIPSPSRQMLPISIQPHSSVTLSVCFKADKPGDFKTRLVVASASDSIVIPIEGKGIKPEDAGKLMKTDFSVVKPKKKKHEWTLKYQLAAQSKVTLQLFDELGAMKVTFLNGAFKNDGAYEMPFDETDKGKVKLPPGKYYVRCLIEEVARGNPPMKFTKEIEIK